MYLFFLNKMALTELLKNYSSLIYDIPTAASCPSTCPSPFSYCSSPQIHSVSLQKGADLPRISNKHSITNFNNTRHTPHLYPLLYHSSIGKEDWPSEPVSRWCLLRGERLMHKRVCISFVSIAWKNSKVIDLILHRYKPRLHFLTYSIHLCFSLYFA